MADICSICGKPIDGTTYLVTDEVTGIQQMVCSNCLELPSCFICGLPVKDDGIELPDGRYLCARDAKTAVLNADDARRVADEVHDSLNKLFARFTSFPTNVDVSVLDRIDVDKMYQPGGYDFESPNMLGCIEAVTNAGQKRYAMRLMTGLPLVELQATAAHEFSHAWAGENIPPERRERLSRDAEEGFCELVAYLLMESQNQAAQEQFILKNHYTRGQIDLFIAAEQRFGFDQILDWMQYGETAELEDGHLENIREVEMPAPVLPVVKAPSHTNGIVRASTKSATVTNLSTTAQMPAPMAVLVPDILKLQGIMWGKMPSAIINRHTVYANDRITVKIGGSELVFQCLEIQENSVRIKNIDSGEQNILRF